MEERKKLAAERKAEFDAAKAITDAAKTEGRDVTDDELATVTGHLDKAEEIQAQIDASNKAEAARASVQARIDASASWATQVPANSPAPANPANATVPNGTPPVSDVRITGGRDSLSYASLGEQLFAIKSAGSPGGMMDVDPRLLQAAISGSGSTIGSDGGFLVQTDFSSEILRLAHEESPIMKLVRKIQISSDSDSLVMNAIAGTSRASGSRWGGVTVTRTPQGGQGSDSKPTLRQVKWDLKKLFGLWYATDELLKDATAMQSIASQAFAEEIAFVSADEIVNGDGSTQMQGYMNSNAVVTVAKESNQASKTIVKENIDKMFSRCWAPSRMKSVWTINQDVEPELFNLTQDVGTGGTAVYLPPGGTLANSPFGTLYGRPVIPTEHNQTLGTKGDITLVDLSQYIMIEKGGVEAAASIHLRFDYDETVFRWIVRNDGKTPWSSALTPAKGTNTLSPFVALATR
jgi:HK97 family phage major capsid protein